MTAQNGLSLKMSQADLRGIWGSSGSDVFVVGPEAIVRYDGAFWTKLNEVIGGIAVWGSSNEDVYLTDAFRILQYRSH